MNSEEIIALIVVFALGAYLIFGNPPPGVHICSACGTEGKPEFKNKGSFGTELILWICFIIPGLIYSIWRLTTKYKACPKCGNESMIPIDTPIGKQLKNQIKSSR